MIDAQTPENSEVCCHANLRSLKLSSTYYMACVSNPSTLGTFLLCFFVEHVGIERSGQRNHQSDGKACEKLSCRIYRRCIFLAFALTMPSLISLSLTFELTVLWTGIQARVEAHIVPKRSCPARHSLCSSQAGIICSIIALFVLAFFMCFCIDVLNLTKLFSSPLM